MPYGAQLKFGIARQTTTGSGGAVTAATSYHHIPLVSHDVGLEKQEVVSQNLNGTFDQGAVFDGVSIIAGTIEVEALPKQLGILLCALVGQPTSVTSAALRTVSYLPRTADYSTTLVNEPFSIYAQFTDVASAEQYFDCQFSQGEFQFSQGQLLRVRATVAGGRRVTGGVASLGIPLDTTDLSAGWLWDVSSISLDGTAVGNFSDITISLNESIEPLYTLNGSLLPYKYTRTGFREVTVAGTILFDSRSMFNDFTAGTSRRLLVTAVNNRVQIQSGYYPTLTLDVPVMKITAMKPTPSGPGEVAASFTARGIKESANNSNYTFKATLQTTWAGGF